ncbi:hypothetical protein BGZ63DRAFT_399573 [Mariannaea sp. PMI_226]|nr:hypothetical protein BGZ63DRAFT_399573 [Mariannaea sp. PMI_226]
MVEFEFCQECIDQWDGHWDKKTSFVMKACHACFKGQENFIGLLRRDLAYRAHIARQMAGYPCDATSQCPHHPPTYQFFQPAQEGKELYRYEDLLRGALLKFRRKSYLSITSLELLSSHYLSQVEYCDQCYDKALSGFEENADIYPCDDCFSRREGFINRFHKHQTSFREPWEKLISERKTNYLFRRQFMSSKDTGPDNYLFCTTLQWIGGGGTDPLAIASVVFAGLAAPALIVGLAAAVYSRWQWRLAVLNQVASELTSGATTITQQDVENASTESFHTAQMQPDETTGQE